MTDKQLFSQVITQSVPKAQAYMHLSGAPGLIKYEVPLWNYSRFTSSSENRF